MLRSVSHRFALVKRYLLDRFAFPFGTCWVAASVSHFWHLVNPFGFSFRLSLTCWVALYRIRFTLSIPYRPPRLLSLASAGFRLLGCSVAQFMLACQTHHSTIIACTAC